MDIQTFKLFAKYNKTTNIEMNNFIQSLNSAQWNQEFDGYFNSIKSICNHLYLSDFNWLKRFSKLRKYLFIENSIFFPDLHFGSTVFETIDDYIMRRKFLDEQIELFVNEITPQDINQYLSYTDSHGKDHHKLFGGLVLHFFNHQTHHRGMISIYLENMKIKNDFSNFVNIIQ